MTPLSYNEHPTPTLFVSVSWNCIFGISPAGVAKWCILLSWCFSFHKSAVTGDKIGSYDSQIGNRWRSGYQLGLWSWIEPSWDGGATTSLYTNTFLYSWCTDLWCWLFWVTKRSLLQTFLPHFLGSVWLEVTSPCSGAPLSLLKYWNGYENGSSYKEDHSASLSLSLSFLEV